MSNSVSEVFEAQSDYVVVIEKKNEVVSSSKKDEKDAQDYT